MDNSLLAVRDINHKYIVVGDKRQIESIQFDVALEIQPIPITFQYQEWEDKSFDFEDIIQYQEKDKQIGMEVTLRKTLEEQYKLNMKNVGKEAIQKVKVIWREDEEYSNENQLRKLKENGKYERKNRKCRDKLFYEKMNHLKAIDIINELNESATIGSGDTCSNFILPNRYVYLFNDILQSAVNPEDIPVYISRLDTGDGEPGTLLKCRIEYTKMNNEIMSKDYRVIAKINDYVNEGNSGMVKYELIFQEV